MNINDNHNNHNHKDNNSKMKKAVPSVKLKSINSISHDSKNFHHITVQFRLCRKTLLSMTYNQGTEQSQCSPLQYLALYFLAISIRFESAATFTT